MNVRSHPSDLHGRRVLSYSADDLADLAAFRVDGRFVLFVAADTHGIDGPRLVRIAENLIRAGATYVCCWGPDCRRFHDAFDEADLGMNGPATDTRLLLTTWHEDEALEEAAWFAVNSTVPAAEYKASTKSVLTLSIGHPDWAFQLREYLEAGAPMRHEA